MIYFRCDVSETIGIGNLRRCLILARALNAHDTTCFILPEDTDENTLKLIHESRSSVHLVPKALSYEHKISHYPKDAQNIILDLGHRQNLEHPLPLISYLKALDHSKYTIVMMDGLSDDSFRDERAPKIKALIQPYWGTDTQRPPNAEHWLHGQDYVLLDEIYINAYRQRQTTSPQKILITFGGADPQTNTLRVVNSLKDLSNIEMRVIVGPFFSKEHVCALKKLSAHVTLIHDPSDLLVHYQWADLGICASGTTRYEAAACGLPLIVTSLYPEHQSLSENFASYGTTYYAGYYKDMSPEDWARIVMDIQNNQELYTGMVNALEQIDHTGNGAQNLAQALLKIFPL